MNALLPQSFCGRDALWVARDLIGMRLRHGEVVLQITETEAYRSINDSANHCRAGQTKRNAPMWGAPGHAYVYLCYGMHHLLNIVTDAEGQGAAVLIRSAKPIKGLSTIQKRRGNKTGPVLLTGPGKVGAALGIDTSFSGHPLFRKGGLELLQGQAPPSLLCGPRVGIGYAEKKDIEAPWRFAEAECAWVSERRFLKPI